MPLALLVGALFTCSAIPAAADFITSTVSSPQVQTATPGQLVATGSGGISAEAVTDYGLNKAYATSSDPNTNMKALSDWVVNFTLSGNGLTPGTPVPLNVEYIYDANVGVSAATGHADFSFRLGPNAQGGTIFFGVSSSTWGGGFMDQCPTRFPQGGDHPPGACAGDFAGNGFATDTLSVIGSNTIEGFLEANGSGGTSDAFNTFRILGIVVPDGVDWSYGSGVTGNPLNFQHAATSAVPEPSTFGLLGGVMATLLLFRKGSFTRPRS